MYANIIHTKQLLYYGACAFSTFGGVQAMTGELQPRNSPKTLCVFIWTLLACLCNYSRHLTYTQATPKHAVMHLPYFGKFSE